MGNAHRLVVVGDSLSQGFMSGAIHRTDISYPVLLADALGVRDRFHFPRFDGGGGLPVNLERILVRLSDEYGPRIRWWNALPALARVREIMDVTEDYWERGRGSKPSPECARHHNLAVWGFEVDDAVSVTEAMCRAAIPRPTDNYVWQVPEMAMYRTARRTLNPTFNPMDADKSQLDVAAALAQADGVENLIVALGANNALGTVVSLQLRGSVQADLTRPPHERSCTLYRPEHFEQQYRRMADKVDAVGAQRVFVANVPKVTIPPVSRGVSPGGSLEDGYYEYYTRPWIWDDLFDPDKHPNLSRDEVREIDACVQAYNQTIARVSAERGWHLVDLAGMLDALAFRRQGGQVRYVFPDGLVRALQRSLNLSYLVRPDGTVRLDTRFLRLERDPPHRLEKGGLFSLDGVHPTSVGYGLMADAFVQVMAQAGVPDLGAVDWDAVVAMDTLLNQPPSMISHLQETLGHMEQWGLLTGALAEFE